MNLIIDRLILSRIERLSAFATSLSNLPSAVKGETVPSAMLQPQTRLSSLVGREVGGA